VTDIKAKISKCTIRKCRQADFWCRRYSAGENFHDNYTHRLDLRKSVPQH